MVNFQQFAYQFKDLEFILLYKGAGCPADIQPWCCEIPATHMEQMIVGAIFIFTGVPSTIMMCNVIFSKVLGPYPQVKSNLSPHSDISENNVHINFRVPGRGFWVLEMP